MFWELGLWVLWVWGFGVLGFGHSGIKELRTYELGGFGFLVFWLSVVSVTLYVWVLQSVSFKCDMWLVLCMLELGVLGF